MAWYWPTIEDESSAESAVSPAVGVSGFIAALTGLLAILSIVYHEPIFGLNGFSLLDSALFILVAWRIKKMSRTWAVIGLLLYLIEVGYNVAANRNGAIGVIAVVFILIYVGAIRGAFAFHRYRKAANAQSNQLGPANEASGASES
jgi:hypothetical protein